jgi:cytidine deaminase
VHHQPRRRLSPAPLSHEEVLETAERVKPTGARLLRKFCETLWLNLNKSALIHAAARARKSAVAPYSKFLVGAALLTRRGEIITGANVESASYGLTCCAERVALFKALTEGKNDFTAIAVVTRTAKGALPLRRVPAIAGRVRAHRHGLCGRQRGVGKSPALHCRQTVARRFSRRRPVLSHADIREEAA